MEEAFEKEEKKLETLTRAHDDDADRFLATIDEAVSSLTLKPPLRQDLLLP
jgi:hypothetical protein